MSLLGMALHFHLLAKVTHVGFFGIVFLFFQNFRFLRQASRQPLAAEAAATAKIENFAEQTKTNVKKTEN